MVDCKQNRLNGHSAEIGQRPQKDLHSINTRYFDPTKLEQPKKEQMTSPSSGYLHEEIT